jgi:solute carrier family 13 (sodium-dependent dicarboxylate transporter), member 2/3/5
VFLALLALPLDLDGKQQGLAAVLGLVVVWWISEAIPITGVGLCLCVILNVAGADAVFGRVFDAFGFIGAATSPFMSNTGAAAMMLPIALGVMASLGRLIIGQPRARTGPSGCASGRR